MTALVEAPGRGVAGARESSAAEQVLTFTLRGETFAMPIAQIKEIIGYGQVTPVPMMPDFICGVINLRGAVVPVIDLGCRFRGTRSEVGRRSCIVILELHAGGEPQVVGAVVDAVSAVLEIAAADIEPAPAFGAQIRADFIRGMAKVAGRFVVILDVDRALSAADLAAVARAEAAGEGQA